MKIRDALDNFSNVKVLVIGDLMLDQYIKGNVDRISPEAPVQVVNYNSTENVPGGAGNVVFNLAQLGVQVFVCGVVGNDIHKDILFERLKMSNININNVVIDESRPTTVKQRIVAWDKHQLLRVDYEDKNFINKNIEDRIINGIMELIKDIDIILISDYAKGVITKDLVEKLVKISKENNKKIIVDAKPINFEYFKGVDLIEPNINEAEKMANVFNDVGLAGKIISEKLNSHVFITRGKDGVSVFEKGKKPVHIKTHVEEVFDVTGAGDTFMAISALGLATGLSYIDSAKLANIAAGIVVQKKGTSFLSLDELKRNLEYLKSNGMLIE